MTAPHPDPEARMREIDLPTAAAEWARMLDRRQAPDWDGLDPGIRDHAKTLWDYGVETFQSCHGGAGHAYTEPTIEFHGDIAEGFRALGIALTYGPLPVLELRRVWSIQRGEPVGPHWAMTFTPAPSPAERPEPESGRGGGEETADLRRIAPVT